MKMKKEVTVPEGIEARIEGRTITVLGPKGQLEKTFSFPRFNREITMEQKDGKITITTATDARKAMAMAGTIAAHLRNMFIGVADGYSYELKILYTHFPITVTEKDGKVEVKNFLGEKGIRKVNVHGNCKVHIEKDIIKVSGINVEDVGQTSANIERACKLRGRDRRIFQDGIFLTHRKLESGKEI
jgi:large subunit ribosomal protein L6